MSGLSNLLARRPDIGDGKIIQDSKIGRQRNRNRNRAAAASRVLKPAAPAGSKCPLNVAATPSSAIPTATPNWPLGDRAPRPQCQTSLLGGPGTPIPDTDPHSHPHPHPQPDQQARSPPGQIIGGAQEETGSDLDNNCAACGKPIKERYLLMALDKRWHEDCLKCACCDCRLGEVGSSLFTHSDKILCRRDFLRIFGQPGHCAACKKTIPPYELVMRAQQNAYHMECFACQRCQYRFCVGDHFHLTESTRVVCTPCRTEQMGVAASQQATSTSDTKLQALGAHDQLNGSARPTNGTMGAEPEGVPVDGPEPAEQETGQLAGASAAAPEPMEAQRQACVV